MRTSAYPIASGEYTTTDGKYMEISRRGFWRWLRVVDCDRETVTWTCNGGFWTQIRGWARLLWLKARMA